jgi:hypothetical protein
MQFCQVSKEAHLAISCFMQPAVVAAMLLCARGFTCWYCAVEYSPRCMRYTSVGGSRWKTFLPRSTAYLQPHSTAKQQNALLLLNKQAWKA